MNITIKVEAPELTDAVQALAKALSASHSGCHGCSREAAPEQVIKKEPKKEKQEESKGETAEVPSIVELRALGREKGSTMEGREAVKGLLEAFGYKNLSEIPGEKRAEFMARLSEL